MISKEHQNGKKEGKRNIFSEIKEDIEMFHIQDTKKVILWEGYIMPCLDLLKEKLPEFYEDTETIEILIKICKIIVDCGFSARREKIVALSIIMTTIIPRKDLKEKLKFSEAAIRRLKRKITPFF